MISRLESFQFFQASLQVQKHLGGIASRYAYSKSSVWLRVLDFLQIVQNHSLVIGDAKVGFYDKDMDNLIANFLDVMRVRGAVYVGKTLEPPWNMLVAEHNKFARFHLIVSGSTWIELPGTDICERLNAGDFVIIPKGRTHALMDHLGNRDATCHAIPDVEVGPDFQSIDLDNDSTSLLCGYFQIADTTPPAITSQLPSILIERSKAGSMAERIKLIVKLVGHELSAHAIPSPIVLNRLTEILCLYTIHHWLEREFLPNGNLSALADPRLHHVLNAIHSNPTEAWTVDSLAKTFGQSRTAFSVHFKNATGLSPINYVATWRAKVALQLLEESNLTLDEIAHKAGYTDTNAFNRAFKREMGTPPGTFRKMANS